MSQVTKAISKVGTSLAELILLRRRFAIAKAMDDASSDVRREFSKALFVKQFERTENTLTKTLTPFFQEQIASIVKGLNDLEGGKSFEDEAKVLIDQVFDPDEWFAELVNRTLPVLAVAMARESMEFFLEMGIDITRGVKAETGTEPITTASQWLLDHPGDADFLMQALRASGQPLGAMTQIPVWLREAIAAELQESFSQDYWRDISETTGGDAERIIITGLDEGWSIDRMVREMKGKLGEGKYARNRAENIARTESGNALNGARRASIDQLQQELGPQVPMRPVWLSVLGNTTRDTHAVLDAVPADENGEWNLAGTMVPWPSHFSLPPSERCNCQCTIIVEFGMDENEAQQLIQEHLEREEQ